MKGLEGASEIYSPVAGFSTGFSAPVLARQSCASSRTYFLLKMRVYVINDEKKMMKRLLLFDGFIIYYSKKLSCLSWPGFVPIICVVARLLVARS